MDKKSTNRRALVTSQIYRNSRHGRVDLVLDIGKNNIIHNISPKHIEKLISLPYELSTLDFSSSTFKLESASFLQGEFHSLKVYVF